MNFTVNEGVVNIPPYLISGRNQLQYFYDLKPYIPGYCEGSLPENIVTAIDADTTIDFSNTIRYLPLPNLRSEDRRAGKAGVRTCRSRWSQYQSKQNTKHNITTTQLTTKD